MKYESVYPGARSAYSRYKEQFINEITNTQSAFEKERFVARFEISNRTLSTVGFFFLAPLLAILAWLILVISGTANSWTFALVSFSVGLTTNTIVDRVRQLVGQGLGQNP